jgi:hypothetical protein
MQLHTWFNKFPAAALVSLAIGVALASWGGAQDAVAPPPGADAVAPPPGADPEGVETLTRGPVHEAFAAPSAADPKPAPVIPKKPPQDIDEVQPDFRPEGAIWINGYWEWDPEIEDFIWISGLWRVPPPEMRWVPPYWIEVEGGWQRVPGFWISTAVGELEYRPTPPASLEVGPSSPAPADNYFYIPGTWTYYDTGFRWRSGYWSPYREDWVWCPARWIWTPAGCLYQAGYWDLRPLVRAQCYAPIRFTSAVYLTPGWRYRPWCVVDSSRFFVHLWIGPRSNCYYFGNYYGSYATTFGLTPWCNWSYRSRGCYDPLWSWCHTHYRRQGIDYIGRVRGWHDHFDHHEHERPARTWNEQVRLIADAKLDPRSSQRVVAADLADVVKRDDLPVRLTRLDDRERESIVKVSNDLKKLHAERVKIEREARVVRVGAEHADDGHEHEDGRPAGKTGQRPNVARAGRTPRIELPKASGESDSSKASSDLPRVELPGRDVTATADAAATGSAPAETSNTSNKSDKPDAGKVASRLDELSKELSSRGGENKQVARIKLPEQTDAIREVVRSSRPVARGDNDKTAGGGGLKEATIKLPGRTEGRPRIGLDGGSPAGGAAGALPAGSNSRGGQGDGQGEHPTASAERSRRSSAGPRIELPQSSSAGVGDDAPRVESRSRDARSSQPRTALPKIEIPSGGGPNLEAPKGDAPRLEASRVEPRINRSGENSIRSSQPRISLPQASGGESGGARGESSSSRSSRSSGGAPRIEAPKITAPRIDSVPRSAPRIEIPRSSQSHSMPRAESLRSMSRPEGSRNFGGGNSVGGSRSRSRGRDD